MKAEILDYSIALDGTQRVTLLLKSDFRQAYDRYIGKTLNVRFSEWKEARSNNQNAFFHSLVNEIAGCRGLTEDDVKRQLVVDYGTLARDSDGNIIGFKLPVSADVSTIYPYTSFYKEIEENGKRFNCFLVYKHTSEMDSAEFSRLLSGTIDEAKELGIDTDTPETKARFY
ncbi:MAG: hypothetical protein MJY95_08295 [Bacteroidaceae bacterium]|nr:hypothetical protein [Bacteroidaceae bacterium]